MFDSQKLSFDKFVNGYRHGIYVLVSDVCHVCQDYMDTISYIDNAYLYFVEVSTDKQRDTVESMLGRGVLPLTACIVDNKVKYVRAGQLFDTQLEEIMADLKTFGDKPLPPEEIERRIKLEESKCKLAYYIFLDKVDAETRRKVVSLGIKFNELPIDVDAVSPGLPLAEQERLFAGMLEYAKLIVIKNADNGLLSAIGNRLLMSSSTPNSTSFEVRMVSDFLEKEND